jgi:hypothetical protein
VAIESLAAQYGRTAESHPGSALGCESLADALADQPPLVLRGADDHVGHHLT